MSDSETLTAQDFSPMERRLILATMSACTMLYALTLTIVSVALPQLQGALGATPDQVSWVVTLNVVATGVATPMTGWIVARFGQRRVLIWAIVGFTISTMFCASATSLGPLLIYRIGQGLFGAPLVPLAQAIIVGAYPENKRAGAQSVFGMSVVIGPAIAPTIGGYLAEEYNWRWVFLLVLPLCVVSLAGVLAFIRDFSKPKAIRLDWTGFLALSIAITCLQLMMDRGERRDWFDSAEIVMVTTLMALGFYVFVVHSLTHEAPFISPTLFLDRNFTIGLLLVFVYGTLNITPTVILPSMLQSLQGFPDSMIGSLLASRGGGMVFGFLAAARIGRLDPRIGLSLGLALVCFSGWRMAHFGLDVAASEVAWVGAVQGFGCGVMWVPLSIVTFATLSPARLPEASSLFHLLRNFGSSIFISLSVMAIIRTGKVNYSELTEHVTPFKESLHFDSVTGLWNYESIAGLAAISREITRQADMIGYSNAFLMYTLTGLLAAPFLFFVKIRKR